MQLTCRRYTGSQAILVFHAKRHGDIPMGTPKQGHRIQVE